MLNTRVAMFLASVGNETVNAIIEDMKRLDYGRPVAEMINEKRLRDLLDYHLMELALKIQNEVS